MFLLILISALCLQTHSQVFWVSGSLEQPSPCSGAGPIGYVHVAANNANWKYLFKTPHIAKIDQVHILHMKCCNKMIKSETFSEKV